MLEQSRESFVLSRKRERISERSDRPAQLVLNGSLGQRQFVFNMRFGQLEQLRMTHGVGSDLDTVMGHLPNFRPRHEFAVIAANRLVSCAPGNDEHGGLVSVL